MLAVEAAAGERSETWRGLLQGLVERGLRGAKLVISDDHDAIKQAVKVELPGAAWQRCVVHFERNVLAHVPQAETKAVAADLEVVFQAARRETAEALAASFAERYRELYPKAVAVLSRGLDEALTYTAFPSSHHRLIRTTNGVAEGEVGVALGEGGTGYAGGLGGDGGVGQGLERHSGDLGFRNQHREPPKDVLRGGRCNSPTVSPQHSLLDPAERPAQ